MTAGDVDVREIVAARLVEPVFQPIVELDSGRVVGLEALARGPRGSSLESPGALFPAAARCGLERELDRVCRSAAVRLAADAGVPSSVPIFLNVEPASLADPTTWIVDDVLMDAAASRSIVVEVTERDLAAHPAGLIAGIQQLRRSGFGVAVDDLGAEPASLALLPLVAPDVIKLDMSLVHRPTDAAIASLAAAVSADAERRDALVIAEGIETDEHRERAVVLGASLGQGWQLGRPRRLEANDDWRGDHRWPGALRSSDDIAVTPWSLVEGSPRMRRSTKSALMPLSRHLEQRALESCDNILLGAFQHQRFFTPYTGVRYAELVARCEFVAVVAAGLEVPSIPDLRTADIHPDHPLRREWTVVVLGPHVAAALIAREAAAPEGDDRARPFDYVLTHDRDVVVAAARSLAQHVIARS